MTTLVGIKAEREKEVVILGSDMSRTQTNWQPQGDIAYREQRRTEGQKIYLNNDKNAAICMTGIYDQPYINFLSSFIEGKFDIEKITKEGYFRELLDLNLSRWQGRLPQSDTTNSLLLATRVNNKPSLHTCWPLGRVEERLWISIGSGSSYASNYLSEQGKLIPRGINLNEAVELTVNSLDKASQDIYTGGLDLIAVTSEKIYDLGKNIRESIDRARGEAIRKAVDQIK